MPKIASHSLIINRRKIGYAFFGVIVTFLVVGVLYFNKRAHIIPTAEAANNNLEFSKRIRENPLGL